MRNNLIILAVFLSIVQAPSYANMSEYFASLYSNYLEMRHIDKNDRETLDYLYQVSNKKVVAFEEILDEAETKSELDYAIGLLNEEYNDFMENINFEIEFVPNCPISRMAKRRLKKAHKNYMHLLEKNCRRNLTLDF